MQVQPVSGFSCSFGFKSVGKKPVMVKDVLTKITEPIRKANDSEKKALSKALGLTSKNFQTNFESHGNDIISGEVLPNIDVMSKGISPMEAVGNVINVELARIRGQLKRVSIDDLKL